jgi:hypothetical protein
MGEPLHIFSETRHQSNRQGAAGLVRIGDFPGAPGRPKRARNRSRQRAARRFWPDDLCCLSHARGMGDKCRKGKAPERRGCCYGMRPSSKHWTRAWNLIVLRPAGRAVVVKVAGARQDMIGHDDARPGGRRADKAQCLFRRADARDRKSRLAQNRFADTQLSQVIVDEKSRGHETSIRRASRRGLAGAYTHTRRG